MDEHYPFTLRPLPYPYDALEPYIDAKTVEVHHNRHLGTYVEKLNRALENWPIYHSWSLERLLRQNCMLSRSIQREVFNNGGGVYNHNFYFDMLTPGSKGRPYGALARAIDKCFGSFDSFKNEFTQAALDVFGSGYAWLRTEPNGCLQIIKTANQETDVLLPGSKLLLIDVWEHAYYLKYLNKRIEYIENIYNLFDWEKAEGLYLSCLSQIG